MLITPRTYSASQTPDRIIESSGFESRPRYRSIAGWKSDPTASPEVEMLLIRQTGSVRVGEVVRYTLTYNPAGDSIQPPPAALHVKVKNTSAIPLRAAYLHGPYTLYASCYPASFDPNGKFHSSDDGNVPQFEPYLKAAGTWNAVIPVRPYNQQENSSPGRSQDGSDSTWIIEIISQVVFSSTASVNFELLVGRDEVSLDLSSGGQLKHHQAADLRDHWSSALQGKQLLATKGVFSDSVTLLVDDTASLWNTPHLPSLSNDETETKPQPSGCKPPQGTADPVAQTSESATHAPQKQHRKRIHLVVLTHGLHSNVGADMLYLKESIDAASKKIASQQKSPMSETGQASANTHSNSSVDIAFSEEQVVVRGFPGNAARTERGIQYLGKRLAKYVLLMTYPDQPHFPHKKTKTRTYTNPFSWGGLQENSQPAVESLHTHMEPQSPSDHHAYQITSISFIGHSLGGLVQTYAIAYIQKHSPEFFDKIRPINFIALATPFLGLSNENPMYVRFALDFGLVGRTGQDLGLSWTAPRVRSGWETIIGGKPDPSNSPSDARAKPLLRILPSGPAHEVLAKFKHRTVYSNLVNDGIVPLRTSCLLFLDWKGLERVDKARRENGIVGTMAEWGWAELTGANSKSPRPSRPANELEVMAASSGIAETPDGTSIRTSSGSVGTTRIEYSPPASTKKGSAIQAQSMHTAGSLAPMAPDAPTPQSPSSPLSGFFSMFKPKEPGNKHEKILKRSQTVATSLATDHNQQDSLYYNHRSYDGGFNAPPKTTVFESAGDILMPPLPPMEYIMDPASRPRTILHDRTYHSDDIPPPIFKRKTQPIHPLSAQMPAADHLTIDEHASEAGLKVEEKIARAYHRGLSWRKVLTRLEPDAHNNIIVRRMFTNAYGWPVVQHLVETHFGSCSSTSPEDNSGNSPESPIRPVPPARGGEGDITHLSSTLLGSHNA
ncbi:Putative Ydl109c-like protein [Aspergillus calidoustus]|uniref:Putative Ydl109c-like protein n=1 Tax=Aspergillus calidoustus TaxID=454130 RepID=A0A0U5GXG3_ASPCI|nr:Putative Ydl109c-like protein [Aspergillus calidoustus]